jgi:predicted phosphodiesterase
MFRQFLNKGKTLAHLNNRKQFSKLCPIKRFNYTQIAPSFRNIYHQPYEPFFYLPSPIENPKKQPDEAEYEFMKFKWYEAASKWSVAHDIKFLSETHFQYVSDLHVDLIEENKVPVIIPECNYLAICGDIGKPTHPNFKLFLKQASRQFKKVFFVPGNHDYDCGPLFIFDKVNYYRPIIQEICQQFNNVHFLDKNVYLLDNDLVILGATLWSQPIINWTQSELLIKSMNHNQIHFNHVEWIKDQINTFSKSNIIVLTHFVPTFQLIEEKYKHKSKERSSWFATDLESMIKPPISHWLCGHTHSVVDCLINGVYCGVNAHACNNNSPVIKTKLISVLH